MKPNRVKEIIMRMQTIASALTADNAADIERLKELAIELFAELDK